jgi:hypothetical protein
MKLESFIFLGVSLFFVLIGVVYWFTSYEDTGTTLLAGAALLGVLAGGYLLRQSRRIAPRPEDRADATLADGAGEVRQFPGPSVWPFVLAFGATVLGTGLVFGVWVVILGISIFFLAAVGYVAESRG